MIPNLSKGPFNSNDWDFIIQKLSRQSEYSRRDSGRNPRHGIAQTYNSPCAAADADTHSVISLVYEFRTLPGGNGFMSGGIFTYPRSREMTDHCGYLCLAVETRVTLRIMYKYAVRTNRENRLIDSFGPFDTFRSNETE